MQWGVADPSKRDAAGNELAAQVKCPYSKMLLSSVGELLLVASLLCITNLREAPVSITSHAVGCG